MLLPVAALLNRITTQLRRNRELSLALTSEVGVSQAAGLVALVSRPGALGVARTPAADALYYHCVTLPAGNAPSLHHCWLIHTPATAQYWQPIADLHTQITVHPVLVENGESAAQTFDAMNRIYVEARRLGLKPSDIVADCTGATKPMSVGMALAVAARQGRSLEYLPTSYDSEGHSDFSTRSTPLLVRIGFFAHSDEED